MVEIIPKPTRKIPFWQNILLYFVIVLLIAIIASYFTLNYSYKKADKNLKDLKNAIAAKETPKEKALEKEVIGYKKKIEDFSFLLEKHQRASKFFSFLEKSIHPKVWFSSFSLDLKEHRVTVSGSTESFWTLGQQLLIFQKDPLIKEVNLSGISIGAEKKINFTFNLLISPQIFK